MDDTQQQEKVICGHKTKTCRKCSHRYTKDEYELWACPECGEDRKCKDAPMNNGSGKCQRAGGKSLAGIASPRAKAGLKYSRYVPKRLRKAHKDASENPNFLSLRFELDLIEARLDEIARMMDEEAPGFALWEQAEKAFSQFTRAQSTGSVPGMQSALGILAEKLATGKKEAMLYKEQATLQDQKSRLLMAEMKLMKELGKSIPLPMVMNLMRRVQEIVFREIKDREVLRIIADEFRTLEGD
jgi:hypothetical protein